MLRNTFPDEDIAWKREVERILSGIQVGMQRVEQLAGPAKSSGNVIGGIVPAEKLCMRFDFEVTTNPPSCHGCDTSQCKTVTIGADIKVGSTVVFAAGSYDLKRTYSLPGSGTYECFWYYEDPSDATKKIHFSSASTPATTFQSGAGGSIYYKDTTSCETHAHDSHDPGYTSYPSSVTVADTDCDPEIPSCDVLHVQAEIKWNAASFAWVQSIFKINGVEGGGSIDATFSGATFTVEVSIEHDCYTGEATFHAPQYIDDLCRPLTARRATPADGWPTTITGRCVDCTPHTTTSTTTSTTSTSTTTTTTTSSTTASTTTGSSTTGSSTTGSSTTGSSSSSSSSSTTAGCVTNGCDWTWSGSDWTFTSNARCVVPCAACVTPPAFSGMTPGETATTNCEVSI